MRLMKAVLRKMESEMIVVWMPKTDCGMPNSCVTGMKKMLAELIGSASGSMRRHVPKNTA